MARKNRFSNKKIVVKDTRENEVGDTLDGLPALNFVDGEARYFPIKKGDKEHIAIFNVDKSAKVNNLKGPQRSGFIIPVWFSMLCESPRVHRRPVCLSQATLPDSFKLS
ncbi:MULTISPECIES: hypothetical protein [unclassified Pseudoalteromonas]|uniref:hypothetical protein n=2 Tax=Pseudoalteromonas TaxID=53246 RepID=UPI0004A3992B|nr:MULTISPECIES: hypothetical protein [unclassified Pseudoalteromonas]MDC9496838.1 hypothetical protein [Pseudoalteromonas sp. Angola-20]MDC9516779.1 hypothetical protein [Pseudoalteromonas sp. Angola-22]MDC9533038.1 hypothetical protein [Pseudoalteromonas sp. Angola-9]